MNFQSSETRSVSYELKIEIVASISSVWRALTEQMNDWWLPSYHMLGIDSLVLLEPKAGGRLYEQSEGRELLWYTVALIEAESSLTMVGYISPQFGGPATTMLTLSLSSTEHGTSLHVSDALYGCVSDSMARSLYRGWNELFHDGLKAFAEGKHA